MKVLIFVIVLRVVKLGFQKKTDLQDGKKMQENLIGKK